MFQLVDQTSIEKESNVYGALPKVCLVVSQLHRIGEMDFDSAQNILRGSMKQFPDLYFLFLTDDVSTFEEMARRNVSNEMVNFGIFFRIKFCIKFHSIRHKRMLNDIKSSIQTKSNLRRLRNLLIVQ
jgi:hypothetical protein